MSTFSTNVKSYCSACGGLLYGPFDRTKDFLCADAMDEFKNRDFNVWLARNLGLLPTGPHHVELHGLPEEEEE